MDRPAGPPVAVCGHNERKERERERWPQVRPWLDQTRHRCRGITDLFGREKKRRRWRGCRKGLDRSPRWAVPTSCPATPHTRCTRSCARHRHSPRSARRGRPIYKQPRQEKNKQGVRRVLRENRPESAGGGDGQGDDLFSLPRNGTAPLAKGYSKGVSGRQQHTH